MTYPNPHQQQVIDHLHGPLLVLAPAGTGNRREQFDFFRRQEIKDLLARLRLLLNPADSGALQRLILRPACGIGPATLQKLSTEGRECGLRLTDLAQLRSHRDGEPFRTLLHALAYGTVVVFDVETTGLSPAVDEVIDIGAVKLVATTRAKTYLSVATAA